MKEKMLQDVKQYKEQNQRKRIWRRIVRVLACVVVFCTTYALILPAITMEKNTCGMTEHAHSENCYERVTSETVAILACDYESLAVHEHTADCYNAENCLVCGQADYLVHTHSQACLDENGAVVCRIPERREHEHTEDCYRVEETESAAEETIHTHGDECYTVERGELTCQQAETAGHSHGEACFAQEELVCQLTEEEAHTHDASCYESQLMCELSEEPEHWHTDECYEMVSTLTCPLEEEVSEEETVPAEPVLICEKEEIKLHSHDEEDCYETYLDAEGNEQKRLVCTKLVVLEHKHAENCYVTEEVPLENADALTCALTEGHTHAEDCYDETGALICAEEENHTHSDLCYGTWVLICDQEVHTHTDECRAADGGEETTAPTDSAEGLKGTLTQIETEIINSDQGISPMSSPAVRKYVAGPELVENSTTVTWAILQDEAGKYYLRFDTIDGVTEGQRIPDVAQSAAVMTPWRDWLSTNRAGVSVTVEFGPHVTYVGERVLEFIDITSISWGGIETIGNSAFIEGKGPKTLVIPKTVTSCGAFAFNNRKGIEKIEVEERGTGYGFLGLNWNCFKTQGDSVDLFEISNDLRIYGGAPKANVSEYVVSEDNTRYYTIGGVLFSKPTMDWDTVDKNALIDYPILRKVATYTVPEGVQTLSKGSLAEATIDKLVISPDVTKVGLECFRDASIKEIFIADGSMLTADGIDRGGKAPLYGVTSLTNIRYPETAAQLVNLMDSNTKYERYNHFTIPKGITEIGNLDGQLPGLETVTYNAANANITGTKFFDSCSKYDLVIGKDVDQINSGFSILVENAEGLYFEKKPDGSGFYENWFEASNVSTNLGKPLELLNGKLYVDANGVLYELIDDNDNATATARVLYVSRDCPESITIPAILNAKNQYGEQYTVIGVQADAFCCAENLKHVVFENPGNITELSNYAMANCPTLESVNGETTKAGAEALFTNLRVKGKYLFANTGLQDSIGAMDEAGQKALVTSNLWVGLTSAGNAQWVDKENQTGYYKTLTGNTITIEAGVNTHTDASNVYRLYLRLTGDGNPLAQQYVDGYTYYLTSGGSIVEGDSSGNDGMDFKVTYHTTDDANVSYLEFTICNPGVAGEIPVNVCYPSPESAGGSMVVWGVALSGDEVASNSGKVCAPEAGKTIQVQWVTERTQYALQKTAGEGLSIVGGTRPGDNDEVVSFGKPSGAMNWTVTLNNQQTAQQNYGEDHVKSVIYTDTITLPEGVSWCPEMVDALSSGPQPFKQVHGEGDDETYFINDLYVGELRAITISREKATSQVDIRLLEAYLENGQLVIRWKMVSKNEQKPIVVPDLYVIVYPDAINIDINIKKDDGTTDYKTDFTIHNHVAADLEYTYSEPARVEAEADIKITGGAANLEIKKEAGSPAHIGDTITYTITVANTGAQPYVPDDTYKAAADAAASGTPGVKGRVLYVADTLPAAAYLTPEQMETVLKDFEPGEVTISIKNPAITTPIHNEADIQPVLGTPKGLEAVTGAYEGTVAYLNRYNTDGIGTQHSRFRLRFSYRGENADGKFLLEVQKDQLNDNGLVIDCITLVDGEFTGDSIEALLQKVGYASAWGEGYRIEWAIHKSDDGAVVLQGGEKWIYKLEATLKNTFMLSSGQDWPINYPTNQLINYANWVAVSHREAGNPGEAPGISKGSYKLENRSYRECDIHKTAYRGDKELVKPNPESGIEGDKVIDDEVLTYQLTFINRGEGVYRNLPIVDKMYGCQYLLVPMRLNAGLSGMGLNTKIIDGETYYILSKPGDYTDVVVGEEVIYEEGKEVERIQLTAAFITVEPVTSDNNKEQLNGSVITYTGVLTTIKWYFPVVSEIAGPDSLNIQYKAIVDSAISGSDTFEVGNGVWANDRTHQRLYEYVGYGGTIIRFDKSILAKCHDPANPDDVVEDDYSLIAPGKSVHYRLTLQNVGDGEYPLSESDIYDILPNTYGYFEWSKSDQGNGKRTGLVTFDGFAKEEPDGSSITFQQDKLKDWKIVEVFDDKNQRTDQHIVWDDLEITFNNPGTLHLYFTLTFPEDESFNNGVNGSEGTENEVAGSGGIATNAVGNDDSNGETGYWNEYVKTVDNRWVTNTLMVCGVPVTVSHDLVSTGEVMLQKGVFAMYHYKKGDAAEDYEDDSYYLLSSLSRAEYSSRDARNRAVQYYVTIYNGGTARMYLNDLYDKLPKGFTFKEMMSIPADGERFAWQTGSVTESEVTPETNKLTELGNGFGQTAEYIPVKVTPSLLQNGKVVKFSISAVTKNNKLKYDDVIGKHYLDRGEAIVFGYICDIGEAKDTNPDAINVIAMPYEDYLGLGAQESRIDVYPQEIHFGSSEDQNGVDTQNPFYDPGANQDDIMEILNNSDVQEQYGFDSREGQWLVSDVLVKRGEIVPDLYKETLPLDKQVFSPEEIVTWQATLLNRGTQTMTNYVFEDLLPAPYNFTGTIELAITDYQGNTIRTFNIAEIVSRNTPNQSNFQENKPSQINVEAEGSSFAIGYGTSQEWYDISNQVKIFIGPDEEKVGAEVLRLWINTPEMGIPIGGSAKISLKSINESSMHENKVYYNNAWLYPVQGDDMQPVVFNGSYVRSANVVNNDAGDAIGVHTSAGVTVAYGRVVTSKKAVTDDATQKTAVSTARDPADRQIVLQGSEITYTLTVENRTQENITKFVVIDNLPQENDHLTYDADSERGSEFKVNFANEPFVIKVINQDGTSTELNPSQYRLELGEETVFHDGDWEGNEDASGQRWKRVTTSLPSPGDNDRSFRLVINDYEAENLIPPGAAVEIIFKAKVGDDALPGEIAWNNFGYNVETSGMAENEQALKSSPNPVGVSIPKVPSLLKGLVDVNGRMYTADKQLDFRFLIHEGEPLDGSYNSYEEHLAALEAAGRSYGLLPISVSQGKSQSEKVSLASLNMNWTSGSRYTIVEYCDSDKFELYNCSGGGAGAHVHRGKSSYTFSYDPENDQVITFTNKQTPGSIQVKKTDPNGNVLSGAVFALYSSNSKDENESLAARWNIDSEIKTGSTNWFLKSVAITGDDGKITWSNLIEDRYLVQEIKAPDGYILDSKWLFVNYLQDHDGVYILEMINGTYELPETGGTGTTSYTLGGLLIVTAAILMYIHILKRRKEDYTSF